MKRMILFLILIYSVLSFGQTSQFQRLFTKSDGTPLTGFTGYIYLVPQTNDYPTGALSLTEDATRMGVYSRDNVSDGEYKVYVDLDKGGANSPTLLLEHQWIGEARISTIADRFELIDGTYRIKVDAITDGSITNAKFGDGAVYGDKILDNAITSEKINDGAITTTKIFPQSVQTEQLDWSAVTSGKLAPNSVLTEKIATGGVTSDKLASLAVTAAKLGIDAVTTSKILNGTITISDLSQALIDYINAAGGGSITNNPDDITLETKSTDPSTIGIKTSWLTEERKRNNSVFINDYIGSLDPGTNGWSLVFQAAVDANLGTNNTIALEVGVTYDMQIQGDNPYESAFGSKMCVDLKTGGFRFYIPPTTTVRLKDNEQSDATGPVNIFVYEDATELTIDGGGTIDANSTGQSGWTGGYGQIGMGGIIYGYGSTYGVYSNKRIVIKDLALENCFSNPVNTEWSDEILVSNCSAHRFGEGIQIIAAKNVRVTYNLQTNYYNTATDGYETSSCENVIFIGNRMYGDGISPNRGAAGYDCFGTQNALVANNEIIGFGSGFTFGNSPGQAPSDNNLVIGNLISDVEGTAMEQGHGKITYISNVMRNAGGGAQFQGKTGNNPEKPDLVFIGNEFDSCTIIVTNNIRCVFNGNVFKNSRATGGAGLLLLSQVNSIDSMYVDVINNTFQDLYRGLVITSQGYSGFTPNSYIEGNTFRNADIGGSGNALSISVNEGHIPSVVCKNNILPPLIVASSVMDLNTAVYGYDKVIQMYSGATAKALNYVPYNSEIEIYFKQHALVRDMRNTTGGNFMLNGGKDDLFQAGQRLHLTFNSDSGKWYEDWRTFENENKVMNRLIVEEGWLYDDVTASLGTTSLKRFGTTEASGYYFVTTRPCYVIAFGGKVTEARTAGTLTIGLWWNGAGPNYITTIDGTNTSFARRELVRATTGLIPAGTIFHISISTDASWAPTTSDFIGFIEFEY